jgi:hypothetical protein
LGSGDDDAGGEEPEEGQGRGRRSRRKREAEKKRKTKIKREEKKRNGKTILVTQLFTTASYAKVTQPLPTLNWRRST